MKNPKKVKPIHLAEFGDAMHAESDRGCILIACHVLDTALAALLRSRFARRRTVIKRAVDPLFEPTRPFSSFWAKINLAYALGLIHEWVYDDLHTIRGLRNLLAHSHASFSFDAPEVQKLLYQLQSPRRGFGHPRISTVARALEAAAELADKWDVPKKTINQSYFIGGFHYLHGYLTNGTAYKTRKT